MKTMYLAFVAAWAVAIGCGASDPPVRLTEEWPATAGDYEDTTQMWTRRATMRGEYQEALEVVATFKSAEWHASHAEKEADARGLVGDARAQHVAAGKAESVGPYEFEVMLTTWDRRENDLDRGAKSIWKVRLLDEASNEIEPLEIIKDKRPAVVVRTEFPAFGEFATAYIVRFPRTKPLLGPGVQKLRMRLSSPRGGVELVWASADALAK